MNRLEPKQPTKPIHLIAVYMKWLPPTDTKAGRIRVNLKRAGVSRIIPWNHDHNNMNEVVEHWIHRQLGLTPVAQAAVMNPNGVDTLLYEWGEHWPKNNFVKLHDLVKGGGHD